MTKYYLTIFENIETDIVKEGFFGLGFWSSFPAFSRHFEHEHYNTCNDFLRI